EQPTAQSRKTASLYRANDEGGRALANVPSCADAHGRPYHLLHGAQILPAQSPRSARATLHSCSIGTYVRATLKLRNWPNQAARIQIDLNQQRNRRLRSGAERVSNRILLSCALP